MSLSIRAVAAFALILPLLGCVHDNSPSFAEAVLNRPMPADDDARMRECTWIRSEIARQQGLAGVGATIATSPLQAVAYQSIAQQHIAVLESRASNVRCTAAFSNAPAAPVPTKQSFDQCFARCLQYTDRTKDQCFDTCNR